MGLRGKLVAAVEFKAGGDVFHELFKNAPHDISKATPAKIQGCDLHEGEFGRVGSIIGWRYTHDGKEKTAKEVVQAIDEEKKLMEFKIIEGDLMEEFKDFLITIHVETEGGIDLVTWTFKYEKLNEDVEDPMSLLTYVIHITKDIETHHIGKQ